MHFDLTSYLKWCIQIAAPNSKRRGGEGVGNEKATAFPGSRDSVACRIQLVPDAANAPGVECAIQHRVRQADRFAAKEWRSPQTRAVEEEGSGDATHSGTKYDASS